ncbi:hypothetical protein PTSG_01887 [Salpingoeca rosetta]|uniref:TNFR-Cys domain-containing protein n=1 Tax=Salpingoeca rosetta (strain ATCC 50818 / BSB-021) TaxID=946362 RepID=F2TZ88_SALR5|nr:uncharacterized protein PTSG_01887 [Salpingoeca rosetta]EGD78912.1 hypothetical protein PTSG_01887 [Salpingoeca rosetta]|eukprot:XP_004997868.1 hypothetical protein PTSG_01887 [Salpingoeca rosetta]
MMTTTTKARSSGAAVMMAATCVVLAIVGISLIPMSAATTVCDETTLEATFGRMPPFMAHNCSSVEANAVCVVSCNATQHVAGASTTLTCHTTTHFLGQLPLCQEKRPRIEAMDASFRLAVYDNDVVEVAYLTDDNTPNNKSGRLLTNVEIEDAIAEALSVDKITRPVTEIIAHNIENDGGISTIVQNMIDASSPTSDTLSDFLTATAAAVDEGDVSVLKVLRDEATALETRLSGDVTDATNAAARCLTTCPAGQYVSAWCTETQANQCSPCPDGFYNDGNNLDGSCKPCACSSGIVTQCRKDSPPTCERAIQVLGWDNNGCGANQWYVDGNGDNPFGAGCWSSTTHSGTYLRADNGDKDNFNVYARSRVKLVAGTYRFFCHVDDKCWIRYRKYGTNDGMTTIIDGGGQCCISREATVSLDAGEYEMEFQAFEEVVGFLMEFYFDATFTPVPTV